MSEFSTVVIRNATAPIRLCDELLGGFITGIANGNLMAKLKEANNLADQWAEKNAAIQIQLNSAQAELEQCKRDAMKERQAIKLLVAGGFVSEEKANEALNIAHGFMAGFSISQNHAQGCGACGDGCPGKQCRVKEESPPVDLTHAYEGAREDLAIWKRRALEAEARLREVEQHKPRPTGLSEGWNRVRQADGFVVAHSSLEPEPRHKEQALADGYVYVPFLVSAADKLEMVKPEPKCSACGDSGILGHSALCECQQAEVKS